MAYEAGLRYFDTAPLLYGHGLSERRIGDRLRARPRDFYVLSTKVGRLLRAHRRCRESCIRRRVVSSKTRCCFMGHPAVASVIPGARSRHEAETNTAWMAITIPRTLWDDLKAERLIRSDAPVPVEPGLDRPERP